MVTLLKRINFPKSFLVCIVIVLGYASLIHAFKERTERNALEAKEFSAENLYISSSQENISQMRGKLANSKVWDTFMALNKNVTVYIDPRSGRPAALYTWIPLIPGTGQGNNLTLDYLSQSLGYEVKEVNETVVRDVILQHVNRYASLLNIDTSELSK